MAQKTFPNNYDEKELISDDDLFLLADSQSWLRLKKIKWSRIRQNNGDLYKYSIVPSISSWNLTVTLKNYLWQDPSITTPVKIQIWDTVRIITWPLSVTVNAWWNWCNAWSSELATKEIDYFTYLWVNNLWNMQIWISRIPSWLTYSDFSATWSNEKFLTDFIWNTAWTNKVTNIWRFSAILSAGAWYTWSTPSAWFQVINHYINESKWLDCWFIFEWSWAPSSIINNSYIYKINWDQVFVKLYARINKWTLSWSFWIKTPFMSSLLSENTIWYVCDIVATSPYTALWLVIEFWYLRAIKQSYTSSLQYSDISADVSISAVNPWYKI